MKIFALLLLLVGCASDNPPWLIVQTQDPKALEAIDTWNQVLDFEAILVASHGLPIVRQPDDRPDNVRGSFGPGNIEIREGSPLGIYVHELGHALGAGHENVKGSVMQPAAPDNWEITQTTLEEVWTKSRK